MRSVLTRCARAVIAAAALTALGCSSLSAVVEVYDQAVDEAVDVALAVRRRLEALPNQIANRSELSRQFRAAFSAGSEFKPSEGEDFASTYVDVMQSVVTKGELGDRRCELIRECNNLILDTRWERTDVIRSRTRTLEAGFSEYVLRLCKRCEDIGVENMRDLARAHGDPGDYRFLRQEAERVRKQVVLVVQELQVVAASLTTGRLDSDPNVAAIVGAREQCWRAVFNRVFGGTDFGNSEIAIRMENPTEFHMKSATFDPSRVTQAVLDSVEAAVRIAAAAGGGAVLPDSGDRDSGGDESSTGSSDELTRAGLRARTAALKDAEGERLATMAGLFATFAGDGLGPLDDGRIQEAIHQLEQAAKRLREGR